MAQLQPRRLATLPFEAFLAEIEAQPDPARDLSAYQDWIATNQASPLLWAAWFNLAALRAKSGDTAGAAMAYGNAQTLRPDLALIAINLGLLLESAGRPDLALATWSRATQPDDARVTLMIQQGRLLETAGQLAEAEAMLHRVLLADPNQPDVVHHFVHLRQKLCRWPVTPDNIPRLPPAALALGSGPFGIMALTDDIAAQREAAAGWIARKTQAAPTRLAPAIPYGHARIRLGYLSSDFCSHAMSYLITELFERHDRQKFEVFGYCASQEDGTALRQRVIAAFDHVRLIRDLSDEQAANIIRADEIDILIDLNGITDGSRLAVLRWRPAPIQATYLGFIGPVPLPELDYLLCDDIVIPPEHRAAYGVTPLPIAKTYQANDSRRTIGAALTRADENLPAEAFILCCFSKHYKITEPVFHAWLAVLAAAPRAILWLAADNPGSAANLRATLAAAGLAPERLIISERADPDRYMARLALADLFLDSFPYNNGTVASDALRMGVPLITLCGRAFASRMATSLLAAIGAYDGITTSLADYTNLAIRLASDPAAYASYKSRFTPAAWAASIGDIAGFTASLEATLAALIPAPPAPSLAEALSHHQSGRLAQAAALYEAILQAPSPPALAAHALAMLRSAEGDLAAALAADQRAVALDPDFADAHLNLGAILLRLGRAAEALAPCARAAALNAGSAVAHGNLAKALQDLGRTADSAASYRTALTLAPDNPGIMVNFAALLMDREAWADAAFLLRHALTFAPANAMAHANLATTCMHLKDDAAALAACQAAHALNPQDPAILSTLGGVLLEIGQFTDALAISRRAAAAGPSHASAHFNHSHAAKALNLLPEATDAARRAITLAPANATYHFHLAHILLLQGALDEGWAEYDWRWRLPNFAWASSLHPAFAGTPWRGEDMSTQTLLIFTEQGLGDIIQFARYIPQAAGRARTTILAAAPHLHRLLSSIPGVTLVSLYEPLPAFDAFCPLLSLPRALTAIPVTIPYLAPDIPAPPRPPSFRAGIVWAGNPETLRDRFRSPGLAAIAPLFAVAGVTFVILQAGPGRADLDGFTLPPNVEDAGANLSDLADTAALMQSLDVIISSCTAPLHLAGALGRPAFGLIPFAPHFTWGPAGETSSWYPSIRLFRQHAPGRDWSAPVAQIAAALTVLAAA